MLVDFVAVIWVRPPAGVIVPLQSDVPGCVLNAQVWTSFQIAKQMFHCGRVNFGWLAHGSCQLTDGVYDVEVAASSQV